MSRESALEQFSGKPISVLDHGHVVLMDLLGDDSAIVQAARTSYQKGTKTPSDDRTLIRYLLRHEHGSPLEMCEIVVHMRLPISVARQLVRHRTASLNEYSTRYSEAVEATYQPKPWEWRLQSSTNRQGSAHAVDADLGRGATELREKVDAQTRAAYDELLENGVARELARDVLPLATYTEWVWKCDLRNVLHLLGLRLDPHAQWEIRQYAEALASIVKVWVPFAYEAFEDYHLHATTFSRPEWAALMRFVAIAERADAVQALTEAGVTNKREQDEFIKKLGRW